MRCIVRKFNLELVNTVGPDSVFFKAQMAFLSILARLGEGKAKQQQSEITIMLHQKGMCYFAGSIITVHNTYVIS